MIYFFIILLTFFLAYYFKKLVSFIYGLYKTPKLQTVDYTEPVSVILAVYNGEDSLKNILIDLVNQDYNDKIEFIIVDDLSTDNSKEIILEFIKINKSFHYVSSTEGNSNLNYKKRALDAGIRRAKYDILLFTDVDCHVKTKWVSSMVSNFNDKQIEYVVGFSHVNNKTVHNLVSKFQQIDFFMLMIAAFASINNKIGWACSGQNQAYRKNLFLKVGGFEKIQNCLQGDDTLFFQLAKKINNFTFCTNPESYVYCRTEFQLFSFLKQRIRWAGDANIMWRFNKRFYLMILSTFITNVTLLFLFIIKFYDMAIILFFLKFLLEFAMFYIGKQKFNINIRSYKYLLWSVLQAPYIFVMGISSFFTNYLIDWKSK